MIVKDLRIFRTMNLEHRTYEDSPSAVLSDTPISAASAPAIQPNNAVYILWLMGLSASAWDISFAAARIGTIAMIGSAIPIIQVVALVAGVTVISGGLIMGLAQAYLNLMAISWELHIMLAQTHAWNRSVAENGIRQAQRVQDAKRSGAAHFAAERNWGPGGGVHILFPIQRDVAINGLDNGWDTFSISAGHAFDIASVVSGWVTFHQPHTQNGRMPLNLPHFHPNRTWLPTPGHAFFPW